MLSRKPLIRPLNEDRLQMERWAGSFLHLRTTIKIRISTPIRTARILPTVSLSGTRDTVIVGLDPWVSSGVIGRQILLTGGC